MKTLKKTVRKYYKYIDIPWTQPVLSADGTVGGNDFACFASSIYNTNYSVYKAFDGTISNLSSDNTWWCSSSKSGVQYIGFYNPDRIKVTNIRFYNQRAVSGDGVIASGTVQASFDNVNYIDLGTFSGNTFGTVYFDIDLSTNTDYYNYYRIVATGYSGRYATCGELEITATIHQGIEESDSSDYDFYKDVDVYKTSKETERKYYKYIYTPWVQPRVSSNSALGGDSFAVTGENLSSSYPAYQAFDTSTSTAAGDTTTYHLTTYLYFYNPNPICISNVQVTCNGQGQCYSPYTVTFYGSNNNSNWDYLATYSNDSMTWSATISIESLNYYSYYKIEVVNQNYGGIYAVQGYIQDIAITAIERSTVESDSSDYDFIKDIDIYKTAKF